MTIGGLGTRTERRSGAGGGIILALLSSLLVLVGIILFGQELVAYSNRDLTQLQADVLVAGVQVGGLSESEAQAAWEAVYLDQPLTLIYKGSPIQVSPRALGMRTNNEAMLAQVRAQSEADQNFWTGFWAHLWNERPSPIEVPLDATVQEGQLRAFLEDVALRYDTEGGNAGFDLQTLTFSSGVQGSRLDIDTAVQNIKATLINPTPDARRIELPTQSVIGSGANMDDLRAAILTFMADRGFLHDGVTTIGSVFVMDLTNGEEVNILGDVAHSAVSTIKIGIMINYFRYQITAPDPDTAYLLASAIICSHNPGANYLMQVTSDTRQNIVEGLQRTSQTMLDLGAINSWITSPLFVGPDGEYPVIQKPDRPNLPNPDLNAQNDPLNTSTTEDMGTMLAMIYDCAFNGGGLAAVFPNEITPAECQQMIEVLSGVKFFRFSELGTPPDVEVAHKVGYGNETVGDAAIVFSPNTDYVFAMYIWEDDLDNDSLTELDKWELIDETSRLVYNYFNPDAPLTEPRAPANPLGGAACVLPLTSEEINLNNIDDNRFDASGNPVPTACYDWPLCRDFDNWGG